MRKNATALYMLQKNIKKTVITALVIGFLLTLATALYSTTTTQNDVVGNAYNKP